MFIRKHKIEIVLWLFITAFILYFSYASINRFLTFRSNYFDLGIMDQVVYNTSRGRILEMTIQDLRRNASRFAIHFDPILALFAPLYLIYPNPSLLLIVQAISLGLGAFAVYLIGNLLLKNKIVSLIFAVSYLFYFPNQRAVIFDFHSVVLSTSLLLFMIYFTLVKKYVAMLICLVFALLTKEHVGLVTFLYGLYMFLILKERKYSVAVMMVSLLFFVFSMFYIIPIARADAHFALRYFTDLGDSPSDILINIIKNPAYVWEKIISPDGSKYLLRLFSPHLIFIFFAPLELLIALPEILINTLSSSKNMREIYFHYNAIIVPFVFFSSIKGFQRLSLFIKQQQKLYMVLTVYIVFQLISAYRFAPLPFRILPNDHMPGKLDTYKLSLVRQWQNRLSDENIPVATSPKLAPFFTRRQYYYNFLYDTGFRGAGVSENDIIKELDTYSMAKYVVLAKSEVVTENPLVKKFYTHLRENADYQLIFEEGDLEVYQR